MTFLFYGGQHGKEEKNTSKKTSVVYAFFSEQFILNRGVAKKFSFFLLFKLSLMSTYKAAILVIRHWLSFKLAAKFVKHRIVFDGA